MLRRFFTWFDAQRIANLTVIVVVLYVVLWALHPQLIFSTTTTTGGDMGAHVATPIYMREHFNWSFSSLTSWYPGWFDGFPLYTYYFVLPDAIAALLSYVLGYAIAFKVATILGSLLLPIAAYIMGRLFKAPDPVPAALAAVTLPFLFESSFTIDGGNLFSTLAGEYSFSLSLAFALITIGLFARGIRTGHGRWLAAVALSATLAAHLLPWLYALVVIALLLVLELLGRRGIFDRQRDTPRRRHGRAATWFVVSAGAISAALSAWWILPFVTTQSLTNSMGYTNDDTSSLRAIFTHLGWFNADGSASGARWVVVGAIVALFFAFVWRDRLGITFTVASLLAFIAYALDPQSALFNERLIPFWFISIYLSTGWLVGASLRWFTERRTIAVLEQPHLEGLIRAKRRVMATFAVAALALASTLPGMLGWLGPWFGVSPGSNQVSSWASWNYSGYESKAAWPEYHGVITTMEHVAAQYGCGRTMWEYDSLEGRFGTTMALMLLPYWSHQCVGSMEGLFFESAGTTPYHFLNQAELSAKPSNPQVGLDYGSLDVHLGVQHLQMLGVRYYLAFSAEAVAQASHDADLIPVAVTPTYASGVKWHVYLVSSSPVVSAVDNLPNVVSGIGSREAWLRANQAWYLDPSKWPVMFAANGPANWPHVKSPDAVQRVPAGATTVSNVRVADESVAFDVSRLDVPVLVRVSYYDRWQVSGADGPFRVSPNLMVVVPHAHHVDLHYGQSPAVSWGDVISDFAVIALVVVAWRSRWWRRPRQNVN